MENFLPGVVEWRESYLRGDVCLRGVTHDFSHGTGLGSLQLRGTSRTPPLNDAVQAPPHCRRRRQIHGSFIRGAWVCHICTRDDQPYGMCGRPGRQERQSLKYIVVAPRPYCGTEHGIPCGPLKDHGLASRGPIAPSLGFEPCQDRLTDTNGIDVFERQFQFGLLWCRSAAGQQYRPGYPQEREANLDNYLPAGKPPFPFGRQGRRALRRTEA